LGVVIFAFISRELLTYINSLDGGLTWTTSHVLPENYETVLIHDVSDKNFNHMFVTPYKQGSGLPKSFYSKDSGKTWSESDSYIDLMFYDPNDVNGNRLLGYAWQSLNGPAVNKLLESLDGGATWQEFSNLPAEIVNIGDRKTKISNIVFDVTDRNTLYMSAAGAHVWKSTDNGTSWT